MLSRLRQSSPFRSRLRSIVLLATLLSALTLPVERAAAQGTMGLLPGPITTSELEGYADRRGLSQQQRRAAENLHDQYKQEFRALREGDIASFMKQMEEMDGGGSMPNRKQLESFLQRMEDINRRIAAMDNRFFDQLQGVLTEPQLTMLQRVKQARQRVRVSGQRMLWMIGQAPPDLSDIVIKLDLNAAERESIDPLLAQYESRLTADFTKLSEESTKMISGLFDALEKMGFTEESMSDPEQQQKVGEAMQNVMQEMAAKSMESATGVVDLTQRTYRSVAGLMPPETARKLRQRYYTRAFPEASFALHAGDSVFDKALAIESLTDQERAAVLATRDGLRRSLDTIADEVVVDILAWRKDSSPFTYNEQAATEYYKKQQEYTAKAEKTRSDAHENLKTLLADRAANIGDLRQATDGEAVEQTIDPAVAKTGDAADDAADPYGDEHTWGNDQFLPPAISERDLAEYADRLALDEDQRALLKELHQRYVEEWQKSIDTQTTALQAAANSLWRWDEAAQQSYGPTPEKINDLYRMRGNALQAIQKTDGAFFDEVALTLASAAPASDGANPLQRVRLSRERGMYSRGSWSYSPASESGIDISRLVLRQKRSLSADSFTIADVEVFKWEQAVIPLMRERYARSMEAQKVQEIWSAEMTRANQENDGNKSNAIALGMKYQEMMRGPQQALGDANAALAELNRATLAAILAALPSDAASSLRRNYNLRAFPNVFSDPGALEQHIERARALPDLTDEQSRRLSDLAAEYHPAYAALCDEMVNASTGMERDNWMAMTDPKQVEEWRKREEALARLGFDRSELNARSASKLKDILTEDQLKRMGGLPKIEDDESDNW